MAIVTLKRKDQITLVAQSLFKKKGYQATSMRDIAEELGIQASSIYSHIKSKDEILANICFSLADEFFDTLDEVQQLGVFPDERLRLAIISHVQVITGNLNAAPVFLHEWQYLKKPAINRFIGLRNKYEQIFQEIIQDGIDKQVFKEMDVHLVTLMIFSSMNWLYDWYKPNGKLSPEEIGENLYVLILNGLMK